LAPNFFTGGKGQVLRSAEVKVFLKEKHLRGEVLLDDVKDLPGDACESFLLLTELHSGVHPEIPRGQVLATHREHHSLEARHFTANCLKLDIVLLLLGVNSIHINRE